MGGIVVYGDRINRWRGRYRGGERVDEFCLGYVEFEGFGDIL